MKKRILIISVIAIIVVIFIVLIIMNLPKKVDLNKEMEENENLVTEKYIKDLNNQISDHCDSFFTKNKDYCHYKCKYIIDNTIYIGLINNTEKAQKDFRKQVIDSKYISFDAVCEEETE